MMISGERDQFGDDCCVHVALFTAGVAVLTAYFKRALTAIFLPSEQWVFLLLNLLLVAILVTSTSNLNHTKKKKKKNITECSRSQTQPILSETCTTKSEDCEEEKKIVCEIIRSEKGVEEEEEEMEEGVKLTREEVNERAEAFIVMFRQHLVLDARKKKPFLENSSILSL